MKLSIIIPTLYGDIKMLNRLLTSIKGQRFELESLEVVVVFNFNSPAKMKTIQDHWQGFFGHFLVLTSEIRSANIARNLGIRFSTGELVYFLDDDVELKNTEILSHLFELHHRHHDVAAIGGLYELDAHPTWADRMYHENMLQWIQQHRGQDGLTKQLLGGNACYKRNVFDRGFCFDPRISFGGTEVSLNQQLVDIGETLMIDEALTISHTPNMKWRDLIKKAFRQGKGKRINSDVLAHEDFYSLKLIRSRSHIFSSERPLIESFLKESYQFFFDLGFWWEHHKINKWFSPSLWLKFITLLFFRLLFLDHLIDSLERHRRHPGSKLGMVIHVSFLIAQLQLSQIYGLIQHYGKSKSSRAASILSALSATLYPILKTYWFLEYQWRKRVLRQTK